MQKIFVSAPYQVSEAPLIPTHPIVKERMEEVLMYCCSLASLGYLPVAPLVIGHEMIQRYPSVRTLPDTFKSSKYWYDLALDSLKGCDQLHILPIQGWEESIGVQMEIQFALEHRIPIAYAKRADNGLFALRPYDHSRGYPPGGLRASTS